MSSVVCREWGGPGADGVDGDLAKPLPYRACSQLCRLGTDVSTKALGVATTLVGILDDIPALMDKDLVELITVYQGDVQAEPAFMREEFGNSVGGSVFQQAGVVIEWVTDWFEVVINVTAAGQVGYDLTYQDIQESKEQLPLANLAYGLARHIGVALEGRKASNEQTN